MDVALGVRREDRDRWEARTPLVPPDVAMLTRRNGTRVVVQPSTVRAFSDDEYGEAGAEVCEDLSPCRVVMAVKEIPEAAIERGVTYAFFSHTMKGQAHNMGMLRRLVEQRCQLLDYELITDANGRRLVHFGRYAGLAGAIDSLWALGQRLEWEGVTPNPFRGLKQTYHYGSLRRACAAVRQVSRRIRHEGLPGEIDPLVIGLTGYGNVSRGAQEIIDCLGAVEIRPKDLKMLGQNGRPCQHRVLKVVFHETDMVSPCRPGADFDLHEYWSYPDRYLGTFHRWLPFLSVLLNCVYWDERYHRLVTVDAVRELYAEEDKPKLKVIGDISCDIGGSIEFNIKDTHIDNPIYVFDCQSETVIDGIGGKGPVVLAVGNLPCELPIEASLAFSSALSPMVSHLLEEDFSRQFSGLRLPSSMKKALILQNGSFTDAFKYMEAYI